ncbi:MAG: glycosyltransferase family 39 protein [Planctomycetota bacterium]
MNISQTGKIVLVAIVVIVVTTLLLRSWHLYNHLASPLAHPEEVMPSTDIAAFATWAQKIADGDVLCEEHYHPYMDWMGPIAPLQTFERWWGGKEIYHQTPLYPYLLASSYWLTGSSVMLLVLQVLLSTLSVYLVFRIGTQLLDERAGLFAAGLAALFAPSIVMDTLLLRSSLNSSLTLISVWLLLLLRDRPGWGLGLCTGALLAASFLLRPTGLLLMVLGPAVLLLSEEPRRRWLAWVPTLVVGIVVCMAPFVARNVIVGAPALTFSTRGPETVLHSNHRGADPGFMATPADEDYGPLMEKGHESVLDALATAIGTWPEKRRLGWWLWHELRKVQAALRDFEYSNNINFYYYRRATPLLPYLLTFGWFVGAALVGLVLLEFRGRDRLAVLIPLAAVLTILAGLLLGFASGRYRMPLAMLLTIPAGALLSVLVAWAGEKRFGPLVVAVAAAAGLSFLSFTWAPTRVSFTPGRPPDYVSGRDAYVVEANARLRPQEFVTAARVLHERGQTAAAEQLLDGYLAELGRAVPVWLRGTSSPGYKLLLWTVQGRLGGFAGYLQQHGLEQHAARFRDEAQRYREMMR